MTEIRFYHLQKQTLDQALPLILEKALEKGHRAIIKCADQNTISDLDKALWSYKETGFLPHGTAKDGAAESQPIYITCDDENPNNADLLILAGGAQSDELSNYKLCCDMFDGNNENELSAARNRWKSLIDTEHSTTYWQQTDTGGWDKKA